MAEYTTLAGAKDDFLPFVLDNMLSTGYYGGILGPGFGAAYRATFEAAYGNLDNVVWYNTPAGWPSDARNYPWIDFWRGLDNAIGGALGTVKLGDDFWGSLGTGTIRLTDNVSMTVTSAEPASSANSVRRSSCSARPCDDALTRIADSVPSLTA